mmetsp:Transcript_3586/g.7713  ORF Transcript_3586/g.7713 Transcript_3586/m.7713 type:complete len:899 (-) Transcript_3586:17-2713(-)
MMLWAFLSLTSAAIVVHFVPHSHVDLGWLKTIDEYYTGCSASPAYESVRSTLSSVVSALLFDSRRRFVFAEVAFFKMWWAEQTAELKEKFRALVASGQFEFVGGGWSSPDEALTEYWELVETYTLGHEFLKQEFGITPTISWQIDPFGHSAQVAELLSQMGYTTAIINRIHYKDKERRRTDRSMQFFWQPFNHTQSHILTHVLYNHYSSPNGVDFDNPYKNPPFAEFPCSNAESYASKLHKFVGKARLAYPTNHLMVPMGDDFEYTNAPLSYQSMDGLRDFINKRPDLKFEVRYSSLAEYFEAVRAAKPKLEVKHDDFFPYANEAHSYWTGYYTSRPWLKHAHKSAATLLRSALTIFAYRGTKGHFDLEYLNNGLEHIRKLREAVAIMCHHDAITGTSRMLVNEDFLNRVDLASEPVRDLIQALSPPSPPKTEPEELGTCQDPLQIITVVNPRLQSQRRLIETNLEVGRVTVTDTFGIEQNCETQKDRSLSSNYILVCMFDLKPLESATYLVYMSENEPLVFEPYNGELLENEEYGLEWHNSTLYLQHHGDVLMIDLSYEIYISHPGDINNTQASGAYVFRPDGKRRPHCDFKPAKVLQGVLQDRLWLKCETLVDTIITLNKESGDYFPKVTHFVKGLWGNLGKELIVVYNSTMDATNFVTDTNALHNLTRYTNSKPDFNYEPAELISANYYPITSFVMAKSQTKADYFAIVTDHAQGVSANNGCVEVMLLRVCLNDDGKGLIETMPERDKDGNPFREVTHHRLIFDTDESQIHNAERELDEPLLIFYGKSNNSLEVAQSFKPLNYESQDCLIDLSLRGFKSLIIRVVCRSSDASFDLQALVTALLADGAKPAITELSLTEQYTVEEAERLRKKWLWGYKEWSGREEGKRMRVFRVEW